MGRAYRETDLAEEIAAVVAAGAVLVGLAALAGVQERRRAEEQEREEVALALAEILLNRAAGNVLGDSTLAFRFQNTVEPPKAGAEAANGDGW